MLKVESLYATLNLPAADLRLGEKNGQPTVLDPLRRRHVRLTPEEWVRQHFTSFLIHHKGYPAGRLGNEVTLNVNGLSRRCDTVLYGHDREPLMIIEYKAPHIALTQKVFDQISVYNMLLHVDYLVVSNGLQHYCCEMNYAQNRYTFLRAIPDYNSIV